MLINLGLEIKPWSWEGWSILRRGLHFSNQADTPIQRVGEDSVNEHRRLLGKVALNELGWEFEEPFEVKMPFDMEKCSEEQLGDLNVSNTLTFGDWLSRTNNSQKLEEVLWIYFFFLSAPQFSLGFLRPAAKKKGVGGKEKTTGQTKEGGGKAKGKKKGGSMDPNGKKSFDLVLSGSVTSQAWCSVISY